MSAFFLRKHAVLKKALSLFNVFTISMTMLLSGVPMVPFVGAVRPAAAALPTEIQVSTDTADDWSPRIDGDRIVYSSSRGGFSDDIYMFDMTTGEETKITTNSASQISPDISGDVIVWQDARWGNTDIYMFDLNTMTETRVTTNAADQTKPAVSGNNIVWRDRRAGGADVRNADIYHYEIGAGIESQLTTSSMTFRDEPAISGDNIVWNEWRPNWEIFTHNVATGIQRQLTTDTAHQYYGDIDGDKVVYLDNRAGGPPFSIYMYDLTTDVESLVTTEAGANSYPSISGDRIVWQNSSDTEIFMYDWATDSKRQLTTNIFAQFAPDVSNGTAVWQDARDGDHNIYMLGLDPVPVTTLLADGAPPTGDWYTTTPTISLTPDETATPYYSWDGGGETTYTGPFEALSGEHVLSYYSVGENGRTEAINNQEFKVDAETPAAYFVAPAGGDNFIRPQTVDLSGASADNIGGGGLADTLLTIQRLSDGAYWDGVDWGGFTTISLGSDALWDYSTPAGAFGLDGTYMATVSAVDVAGNIQAGPSIITFNYFGGSVTPSGGLVVLTQDTSDALAARVVRASASTTDPAAPDLSLAGYPVGTTLTVELNVGSRSALSVMAHGDPVGWSQTGTTVTVEARTIEFKPSTATPDFDLASALEFSIQFTGDPRLQDSWFASNASEQGIPAPDLSDLDSLRTEVTGVGGVDGWAKAFLPAGTLAAWDTTDSLLSVEIDGVQTTPTITPVAGGAIVDIQLGYSSHTLRFGEDRLSPSGTAVINDGDSYANSTLVELALDATDGDGSGVTDMRFGETTAALAGASYQSYNTTAALDLSDGDGTRTVFAQFRDAAGNESTPATDTIILDTGLPTDPDSVSSTSHATDTPSTKRTIDMMFSGADDALSGVAGYSFDWTQASAAPPDTDIDVATGLPRLAAGYGHTVGVTNDGTVAAVGLNTSGQIDVGSWTGIKAVAAGVSHTIGLKNDGTVVAVGDNTFGQTNVSTWSGIKAVAAGYNHTLGLKSDGTVVAVGDNANGETSVAAWSNIKAIAGGAGHTVGLKSDGTVVAVGYNGYGQTDVSSWSGIIAIAAGYYHTLGLKSDGTVVAAGRGSEGQKNVSSWSGIKAIAGGSVHTVGLKADGTVVAVGGDNIFGTLNVGSWSGITAIAAGWDHTVGLKADGTVAAVGHSGMTQTNVSTWADIAQPVFSASSPALGDGDWYFHLRTKDNAGNWTSTVHHGPYKIDTAPPTGGSISINSGAALTNSTAVNLSLSAVDSNSGMWLMSFSNDGVNWPSGWQSYSASAPWNLTPGDGTKRVYVRFKDNAHNIATAVFDEIVLDGTGPGATVSAPAISTNVSKTKTFAVSWSGTDASSGNRFDLFYKVGSAGAWATWKTGVAAGSANFTGAQGKTYYFKAQAKDALGNTGPWSVESKTIVPLDQSKGIVKRVGFAGTISKASSKYYLGTVRYSTTRGDIITYSFTGNHFALIGTKGPKFSKAVVIIDGVKKTIDAKAGSLKVRQVLTEKSLTMKKHTVKIKNLGTAGRARFEIDGNAVGK